MSGTVASASPSSMTMRFSFWNSMVSTRPWSSAVPSIVAEPRTKPPSVRRSTSTTFPTSRGRNGSTPARESKGSSGAVRKPLEPNVVACLVCHNLESLVGYRAGPGWNAVEVGGTHLDLREGPSHQVSVDQRQPGVCCPSDGKDSVDPSHFQTHHRHCNASEAGLKCRPDDATLGAVGDLLDHHCGGTNHPRGKNKSFRIKVVKVDQWHGPRFFDCVQSH